MANIIFFCLEKMAAVLGVPSAEIYANFRGETVDQFQASMNAKLTYSVAAGSAAKALADRSD